MFISKRISFFCFLRIALVIFLQLPFLAQAYDYTNPPSKQQGLGILFGDMCLAKNSYSVGNKCQCYSGFVSHKNKCVLPEVARCDAPNTSKPDKNKKCVCNPGYEAKGTQCIAKPKKPTVKKKSSPVLMAKPCPPGFIEQDGGEGAKRYLGGSNVECLESKLSAGVIEFSIETNRRPTQTRTDRFPNTVTVADKTEQWRYYCPDWVPGDDPKTSYICRECFPKHMYFSCITPDGLTSLDIETQYKHTGKIEKFKVLNRNSYNAQSNIPVDPCVKGKEIAPPLGVAIQIFEDHLSHDYPAGGDGLSHRPYRKQKYCQLSNGEQFSVIETFAPEPAKLIIDRKVEPVNRPFYELHEVEAKSEKLGEYRYKVTRSTARQEFKLEYEVLGGSSNVSADAQDFGGVFPSGTLIFNPGEYEKTFIVKVTDDDNVEFFETFGVRIKFSPDNIYYGPVPFIKTAEVIGQIIDDDGRNTSQSVPVESQAQALSLARRDIKLFRVVPISGTNPLEFTSLVSDISVATNNPVALILVSSLPVIDNSGSNAQVIVIDIDSSNNLTVTTGPAAVGSNTAFFLFGNEDAPNTADIFDTSNAPFGLVNFTSGQIIAENTTHSIIMSRNNGTFYKVILRFTANGFAAGDMRLDSISGYNCGTFQGNCP